MSTQIYYIDNANSARYTPIFDEIGIRNGLINNTRELSDKIKQTPRFCRDESSILASDLLTYIRNDAILYAFDLDNDMLKGVLTFNVNGSKLNLSGICVPGTSEGVGSELVRTLIAAAKKIPGINFINLDCYNERATNFYRKNGFKIVSESPLSYRYGSDSDSDNSDRDEPPKTKYVMRYDVTISSGGKKITRRRKMYRRKTMKKYRKSKSKKTHYRKTK